MKIQFLGATREVTGSKHLITTDSGHTILLDCGMYKIILLGSTLVNFIKS